MLALGGWISHQASLGPAGENNLSIPIGAPKQENSLRGIHQRHFSLCVVRASMFCSVAMVRLLINTFTFHLLMYYNLDKIKIGGSDWSTAGRWGIIILSTEWGRVPSETALMISQQSDANLLHTQRDRSIIPTGHVLSLSPFLKMVIFIFISLQNASASQPYCICSVLWIQPI